MKNSFVCLLLLAAGMHLFGQNGVSDNFNDNSLAVGWGGDPAVSFIEENGQLEITLSNIQGYENCSFSFPAVDVSANPVLTFRALPSNSLMLRIDLVDKNGYSTNATINLQYVNPFTGMQTYTYNFTNKFNQSYPDAQVVDATAITKIVFFFNAGSSFTGSLLLDDLLLGDDTSIPAFSGIIRKNQIGYEAGAPKTMMIEAADTTQTHQHFEIRDVLDTVVLSGQPGAWAQVAGWSDRYFKRIDFSNLTTPGTYQLLVDGAYACHFEIDSGLLFNRTASWVVSFFNLMRSADAGDRTLSFTGSRNDEVDVYGGWIDAAGDPGKHLSHLSYANHFNPQQIPMVLWSMLKSNELDSMGFSLFRSELDNEIAWGADYLVRSLDQDSYFYLSVFDDWGAGVREICEWGQEGNNKERTTNYQAALREGAGMSIAALARAYRHGVAGDYSIYTYLNTAMNGYSHLRSAGDIYDTKNIDYCNDHAENIIDDYCGLMAATELYKATGNTSYLVEAQNWYMTLIAKQHSEGWFASDDAMERPFYHASDEGLPVLAILEYLDIAPDAYNAEVVLTSWITWYKNITDEVTNPFSYMRQYHKPYDGDLGAARKAFFLPHNNETGYWWQGENARLASMTTAFLAAAQHLNDHFQIVNDTINRLAISQLDWICGKNPYGVCMIYGFGETNYPDYPSAIHGENIKGGICNGITAKDGNEDDLDWKPYLDSDWQNWRWTEQWLPHDSWFLLAISSISGINRASQYDCNGDFQGQAFEDSCGTCAGGNTGVEPVLSPGGCYTAFSAVAASRPVLVYPNPAMDRVFIHAPQLVLVELYDAAGNKMKVTNRSFVDMTDLSAGLYLVKVLAKDGVFVQKVFKH